MIPFNCIERFIFSRMGSLYMPVVELDEDHNIDVKLQDVKFKSINLLKVVQR